jgi:hypothetical protein
MLRTALVFGAVLSVLACGLPAPAAEPGEFIFFGIVTVRDGKTVLVQNPALSDEQVARCKELIGDALGLDRAFSTAKSEEGGLTYTWGEDEGELSAEGLVPYVAYFVTPDQYVPLEEGTAEPREANMASCTSSVPDVVSVSWWAPETTEKCSVHLEFYDETSYKPVATLKGDEITVGAGGTSPDGVKWEIASIAEEENGVVVNVVTDKGPKGHAFVFWVTTANFDEPQRESPWTDETEDGKRLVYPVSCWADSEDELICFQIRERHPDRIKKWDLKDFSLKAD